jgi:hypothetical protein
MATFVALGMPEKDVVHVNLDRVNYIRSLGADKRSEIYFDNDQKLIVQEDVHQILALARQ